MGNKNVYGSYFKKYLEEKSEFYNFSSKYLYSKLINFFRASNSLIDVKDLIHEVKFTTDGKPELKKIGMDDQKEQKLLILSQYLVLHNHDSITIENLTEKFLNFLENYQLKMVDLIFNSLDFLDLGYELLLPEIAKLEKKKFKKTQLQNFRLGK